MIEKGLELKQKELKYYEVKFVVWEAAPRNPVSAVPNTPIFIWINYKGRVRRMNMATVTKKSVNIVINDFLERRLEEAIKKIEAFEDKWTIRFDEFKERCGHDELPDKSDPYSWEVEEDFREWEAAETLKKHYSHILDRY